MLLLHMTVLGLLLPCPWVHHTGSLRAPEPQPSTTLRLSLLVHRVSTAPLLHSYRKLLVIPVPQVLTPWSNMLLSSIGGTFLFIPKTWALCPPYPFHQILHSGPKLGKLLPSHPGGHLHRYSLLLGPQQTSLTDHSTLPPRPDTALESLSS